MTSRAPATATVSSYISPKAVKGRRSSIAGRGLHAIAPIAADEIVAIKGGHIMDAAALAALPEPLRGSDVQIADGLYLAAVAEPEYEPVMLFLNHSCEPNVGLAGNIVLVAMRDIAAGEELTTDYALFDDYDGAMACRCGTASCRAVIGGRDWQLPQLQRRYGQYFSAYLLRKIDRDQPGGPVRTAGTWPPGTRPGPPRRAPGRNRTGRTRRTGRPR